MSSKCKTLTWNDRFALLNHYKPTDAQAIDAFGVTQEELDTARTLVNMGSFLRPNTSLDVTSYSKLFNTNKDNTMSTQNTKRHSTATTTTVKTQTPMSATKQVPAPKKRGRKGDKILKAFQSIPTVPASATQFAESHGVSIAVLRQSKRFDQTSDLGAVKVKKDKATKELMIWREAPEA